jgi:hypothetical protein
MTCHSGIVGMQDFHPNLNVNRGVPIQITYDKALSQNRQEVKNGLFKYWQENENN